MYSEAETPRIVVLISGSGTNLQAVIDSIGSGEMTAEISAVISNRPEAKGLERASSHGIKTHALDHREYDSREAFDVAMMRQIDTYQPDLVVLAGFMRILTPDFVRRYEGRMLNIHPSLLPKYRGLHTHERALEANDALHGVTVHFVTEELDGGPLAIQAIVAIKPDDNADSLAARVQAQEHVIYPLAIKWFTEGRMRLSDGLVVFDGQPLPETGMQLDSRQDNNS
ncbi:phosphoribosylglycinamide formyltransferase [Motiliproteus sp. MSK22-1]|uniref:phosphoribosylglycinamide formyltransferase n=1 Tax=Motiliproteus sp. MSK22-1 TaxID=1897630 RepID=UPI000976340F|nr:phosphoribosylglycinamide formyltransferase [Motiliproteus sp. MSK22-1]OMH25880.1 phosphoribosylglycinamide formyltransferase [Motiliproteus sp. MSK22-1]